MGMARQVGLGGQQRGAEVDKQAGGHGVPRESSPQTHAPSEGMQLYGPGYMAMSKASLRCVLPPGRHSRDQKAALLWDAIIF